MGARKGEEWERGRSEERVRKDEERCVGMAQIEEKNERKERKERRAKTTEKESVWVAKMGWVAAWASGI